MAEAASLVLWWCLRPGVREVEALNVKRTKIFPRLFADWGNCFAQLLLHCLLDFVVLS